MTEDALGGEKLIAMALLRDGYEQYYHTSHAPIHPVVGLGRIVACTKLDDGRFNLLLRGESRAQLIQELPGRAYRFARIESLAAEPPGSGVARRLRRELRSTLEAIAVDQTLRQQMLGLCDKVADLGDLADLLASVTPMHVELQQLLLSESKIATRLSVLIRAMRDHTKAIRAQASGRDEWRLN